MTTTPTKIPEHTTARLVSLDDIPPEPPRLLLASFGDGGCGKTRFIATCPGPVGVIPLNRKCKPTIETVRVELCPDKKFYFPEVDLLRHGNPMKLAMMEPWCENKMLRLGIDPPECCARHYYRWHVNRVKDACWTMAERADIRTIAIDDGTQLYEDILYAHYGRANRISEDKTVYGPPNQEMIDLINTLSGKHLVITHQAKDEYKGKTATGRDTVKGFREVGYYVNCLVEFSRDDAKQTFQLSVRMSQDNAGLHGDGGKNILRDDEITFADLAMRIYDGQDVDLTEYM